MRKYIKKSKNQTPKTSASVANKKLTSEPAELTKPQTCAKLPTSILMVDPGSEQKGEPLSDIECQQFESRLGHDFSRVRIHSDEHSAAAAQDLDARAFTVGQDVYFGKDRFAPDSAEGKELLAHELTHVVQQEGTAPAIQRMPDGLQLPSPEELAQRTIIRQRLRAVLTRRLPLELTDSLRRELRSFMSDSDIDRLSFPIETVDDFMEQVDRLNIQLFYGPETAEERLQEVLRPSRPEPARQAPSLPSVLPEWLSLYNQGMVGFHVSLPSVPGAPLPARLAAPFRARSLFVTSDLLNSIMTNYETGVRELETLLRTLLPSELSAEARTLAELVAEKLLSASLDATLRREYPTAIERAEEQAQRLNQLVQGAGTTREVGPLRDLIGNVGVGVSITLRF